MNTARKLEKIEDGSKNRRGWRHGIVIKASFYQASRAHHAGYLGGTDSSIILLSDKDVYYFL
jgi:hypothetical protein